MKPSVKEYKRIVVKIGSSLFYAPDNSLDFSAFNEVAGQIARLVKAEGKEIVVVSSGAIALGMPLLGLKERPRELHDLQAAAAIGQNEVINAYRSVFRQIGCHGAQVLLTWDDFNDRKRYLNAKNTLLALLRYATIPIINENDTVSTDEIKFGDNDQLSARVAGLISADILIILSDVDGLLDGNKALIRMVDKITPVIKALACPTRKKTCVGGMITKIEAAKIAVDSGIPCIIANGHKKDIILSVINEPDKHGTMFIPKKGLAARERWIAFGTKPKGKIIVDEGAKEALLNNKSLLSVGVTGVAGNFERGAIVALVTPSNLHIEFARGKVEISSKQLERIKGQRFGKEVMHCDNIVILI